MNNEPMTAEQRVRDSFCDHPDGSLGDCDSAACADRIVRLMDEHAAAAVEASEKRIAELERERNSARQEVLRLQQCRSDLDCSYAGAFGESDGASHCPPEGSCQRCTLERERDEALARVFAGSGEEARRRAKKANEARITTILALLKEMPPLSDEAGRGDE